jgi:chaperonin cofactor prefoldin
MSLASINIKFNADLRGFSTEMQNSMRRIGAFGNQMSALGQSMSLYVTGPLLAAGAASIKFASDYNESLNKVDVSFKDSAASVKDFAKTSLESFGIAEGTALDLASSYGDMGTSLGLSTDRAAKMSTSLVGLAGDLASFKNISIDVANTALTAIFTGETESLKKLGIVMTEANLQNFAYSRGLKVKIADMDQASKVNLRYAYILSVTKNAQGDFERTGGGAANQMRIFQESLKQAGQQLGSVMIPAFTKAIVYINGLIKSFSGLTQGTKETIVVVAAVVAAIGPMLTVFGGMLTFIPNLITKFNALKTSLIGLQAVIMANPYAAAAVAIGLIAAATYAWYVNSKNVASSQDLLNKAVAEGNKNSATEVGTLDKLYASATNVKTAVQERKAAVDKLQELYPAYFKNLNDEVIKNGGAKTSYNDLRDAIFNKSRAMAIDNQLQANANDRIGKEVELQDKIIAARKKYIDLVKNPPKDETSVVSNGGIDIITFKSGKEAIKEAGQDLANYKTQLSQFYVDAKKQDASLLTAKQQYAAKTGKLAENEIAVNAAVAGSIDGVATSAEKLAKAGTVAFFEKQISDLQKLQKEVPTTNKGWKTYENQINAVKDKIDALQNTGIILPKPQLSQEVDFQPQSLNIPYYEEQIARYKSLQNEFATNNEEGRAKYQLYADKIKDTELIIQDIQGVDTVVASLDLMKSKSQEFKEMLADVTLPALTDAFSQLGSGIVSSLGLAATGFQGFIGGMAQTITKLIAMMLASSISQSIAGATAAGVATGPASIFTTPAFIATAVSGVLAAFLAIPKFETGGIVGGTSYYGDKILARVNSGELILNNNQQRAVLGAMNGGGDSSIIPSIKIQGSDLLVVFDRANARKNRIG